MMPVYFSGETLGKVALSPPTVERSRIHPHYGGSIADVRVRIVLEDLTERTRRKQ
jgi:hypothetical protein